MSSKSLSSSIPPDLFWESIDILLTKPHVINKRLWGSKLWFKYNCIKPNSSTWELPTCCSNLKELVTDENVKSQLFDILSDLNIKNPSHEVSPNDSTIEVLLMELLPKNYTDKQAYQLVCLQKDKSVVSFYNVTPTSYPQNLCPNFSYAILLKDTEIVLQTANNDENSNSYKWLANTLLPQVVKWGMESKSHNSKNNICSESLSLVCQTEYYEKYNNLKIKYGKEMVKIWPECTDASKFVYEDVAIAAYLLLIWEQDEATKKKTFVDLGCGNGLLVYILTKEGHTGIGIDVRKRNIWDMYTPDVILQEKTITPSDTTMFSNMDWIIGNHSDELTPWIPVIAAKSSYKSNFFLLPCCAYNFDGSKYQRKNSYKSQYNDYLDHIQQLCEVCGFKVDRDRLKIPSTKRICLVSRGRMYPTEEYEQYCSKIYALTKGNTSNTSQDMKKEFKAREPVEKVRNCTQIDKSVIDSIVDCISKYLLEPCSKQEPKWSIGKTAEINELVQLIPKEQLSILKSEFGGIQTLLKNKHNIFEVQSGKVGLRYPKTINDIKFNSNSRKRKYKQTNIKVQQRPCWFYNNHPQSCPLSDTECSFLHIKIK